MPKELIFEASAHEALLSGIEKLANAVRVTLGPKGKTVMIQANALVPIVTKDGVTVAKSIWLEDPFENLGAQMTKDVASKTADIAGDGTTTATVLAYIIAKEGLKNITAGSSSTDVKRGIDKAVIKIIEKLDASRVAISGKKDITKIASISANNDNILGQLIADAMEKVGDSGILTIRESSSSETFLEVVEGMQYDRGYASPFFVNNEEKASVEFENANILLYDGRIESAQDIVQPINLARQSGKPLLIIAEDFSDESLATIILNRVRGGLSIAAIKAPGFGESVGPVLGDIAIQTGGLVISQANGATLSQATKEVLGSAASITITSETTTIVEGDGKDEAVLKRVEQVKSLIADSQSKFETERLKDRLAKLAGGVGVIYVGGQTEAERQEKKDRVDDALAATRAGVSEGIVPGGGLALIRAAQSLDINNISFDNDDEKVGFKVILNACEAPLKQIVKNAGGQVEVVLNTVKSAIGSTGYNARTNVFEDLLDAGIIDPVKVTKSALKNAASIASLILTTDCVIVEKVK
tara:strand:- start:21289 stop:22872 length:1584 start_codon:yes stop_codon:yes gene_type:complete